VTDPSPDPQQELKERYRRSIQSPELRARLERIRKTCRELPVLDDRTAEEIVGYDEVGLPT
jgi:antitoxin VapB